LDRLPTAKLAKAMLAARIVPVYQPYSKSIMSDIALAKGEKFLADNAQKEGVIVTPSGLQYQVITPGTGKSPKATDTVEVHYEGTLIDGTVFDSSYRRKETIEFPLNQVIAGWTEGVQLMQEGAKYRFFIPSKLAYGTRGADRDIGPNQALIFDVELIKVR
jgi:FKBP-type peptidyl-prolyl cis-trans isomerase